MNVSAFSNIIKVRRVFIEGDAVFLNEKVIGELAETDDSSNIDNSKRTFECLFFFESIEQKFMKIEDHLKSLISPSHWFIDWQAILQMILWITESQSLKNNSSIRILLLTNKPVTQHYSDTFNANKVFDTSMVSCSRFVTDNNFQWKFEVRNFYMQCSYLTHWAIKINRLYGFGVPKFIKSLRIRRSYWALWLREFK